MALKGGYVIVDLKGQSITAGTPFTLDGVTARLDRAKTKACLLSGFVIGDEEKRDVFIDLQPTANGYAGGSAEYQVTIEDDEVTITENEDPNKKVYCHPVEIFLTEALLLNCLIFNNSADNIDTWTKLKDAIYGFGGTTYNRLLVTGAYYVNNKTVIASELINAVGSTTIKLLGIATDGTVYSFGNGIDVTDLNAVLKDAPNAINQEEINNGN